MFSSHSIILGLLAATFSLQSGVAARALNITTRSTDITCGGRFPKAGDGFAQLPDGCSSISENPDQVRDKWGSANFGGVCDDHDRCYYTKDAGSDACNNNFCGGLRNACHNAYCKKILGVTVCSPVIYEACTAIAEGYCDLVRIAAPFLYPTAQARQESYVTCIADNGGITTPPPPVLCSNGASEGATWQILANGERCTKNVYICRNGIITQSGTVSISPCIEV